MFFGTIGMSAAFAILAGCGSIVATNNKAAVVSAVMLFVYNTFFAIGWLGMTWLYPSGKQIIAFGNRA